MEDSIEVILQDQGKVFPHSRDHPVLTASTGALLTGLYGLWSLFAMPGFRRIPGSLKAEFSFRVELYKDLSTMGGMSTGVSFLSKQVPYLPSSKDQTLNIMKLLDGRRGRLADLGSGDGRLVFAASSAGFQCTGFEINSMLLAYARGKARWTGVPSSRAAFVKTDFWKTDLSAYNNVTAFLAPGVMEVLGEKLLKELPDDARVVACRFPFPHWPHQSSVGSGLDQTWAYDISTVRSSLGNVKITEA